MANLIYERGAVQIWEFPEGFYIYDAYRSGDARVVQSRHMALGIAGGL